MRFSPRDSEYGAGRLFEIQILDSHGRAKFVVYCGESEQELDIQGHIVPGAVLNAARRQPEGKGDYVNEKGESIRPF